MLISRPDALARLKAAGIKTTKPGLNLWCRKGKIPAKKVGSFWYVDAAHIDKMCADVGQSADCGQS